MNLKDTFLVKYFSEAKVELKKVTWPTRKETINYTMIVIGVCLSLAIFIGAVDFGLSKALELIVAKKA